MRVRLFLGRHPDVWLALGAAVTALAIAVVALRLWRLDLNIPMRIGGDATQVLGYVQNMIESGTPMSGPRLNAPFGQQYADFPLGPDLLNFAMLRVISFATNEAAPTVSLFFLVTFPLIAVAAFGALRQLSVARPVAFVAAVLYAVVPFHFLRGTSHLFLSSYFAVPIAIYLIFSTAMGQSFLQGSERRTSRIGGHVLLAALIATTGIYYAAFTLMILPIAAVVGWLRARSWSVVGGAALAGAVIVVVLVLTLLPGIVNTFQNGPNADFPVRGAQETGTNQLWPVNLLVPVVGHYFPPFASFAAKYAAMFPSIGENGESAGLIASIGLVFLVVVVLGSLIGLFARRRIWREERTVALLVVVCLLIASAGGASSLFALLVTPQIRAWGRMSIFIDFLALLAIAFALTLLWRRLRPTTWRNVLTAALCLGVVFGAIDQSGTSIVPDYAGIQATYLADSAFTGQVEGSLPPGAAIYQVPYRPYPEAALVNNLPDYEPLRPYLESTDLRFSYGGEKGREAGWQLYAFDRQPQDVLPLLCVAQFSAIWVDRQAYPTLPAADVVSAALQQTLAVAPMTNTSDRFEVFDMRPYCANLNGSLDSTESARLQDEVLNPVWYSWKSGSLPARVPEGIIIRDVNLPAQLALNNAGADGREVTVAFDVTGTYPAGNVDIRWPDGSTQTVTTNDHVSQTITLGSGWSNIEFVSDQPSAVRQIQISDFYALDPDLLAINGAAGAQ